MKLLKNFLNHSKVDTKICWNQWNFVFDYVYLLYYKSNKINLNRGGPYIDSPDSIKNKKATINLINKKNSKCFQYAVKVVLDHEEIGKHSEGIIEVIPFKNRYNQEGIHFPLEKNDWEKPRKIM